MWQYAKLHILNIPNFVSGMGALSEALRLSPSTRLVSAGSITPSSHNLQDMRYNFKLSGSKIVVLLSCGIIAMYLALEK